MLQWGLKETMQDARFQLALERFLTTRPYYPCCLLVHPKIIQLERAGQYLQARYAWPTLSIGTTLSETLLGLAPHQRPGEVHTAFKAAVQQVLPGPILCRDIDLLFEPVLAIDPLRLLRDTSRMASLLVLWPGAFSHGALSYARPEHARYRVWARPELCEDCIIAL